MIDWDGIILSKIKKILSNMSSIQNLVGTTKDTGGSTSSGTTMGKLNVLLTKANSISTATNKIGSANDTAGTTLFGKINNILSNSSNSTSVIKSIQRIAFSDFPSQTPYELSISPVNPDRCILYYLDNFIDPNAKGTLKFALESNSLTVTYTCGARYQRIVEFWIIEFC